ncbi:hypothetical protein N431DRAFT_134550 [Stipitochalara longipes BDJ]|nr:hypothetical protein N431DRAFT_134550 [Stipitochalara longipes BDJ]
MSYWTGRSEPDRPPSCSSSMNSSLHGYSNCTPDPKDQDMRNPLIKSYSVYSPSSYSPALPPPPIELPCLSPFECDICGLVLDVKRKRNWRKHVMDDLQPYMCSFEQCKSGHSTFARRRDLLNHEMQEHKVRESFYRCAVTGCHAKLKDPESIFYHQRRRHDQAIEAMQCAVSPGGILSHRTHNPPLDIYPRESCDNSPLLFYRPCMLCTKSGSVCGREELQLSSKQCFDRR